MTANFWLSQHCNKWILSRDTVAQSHSLVRLFFSFPLTFLKDKPNFTTEEIFKLRVYFTGWLSTLGEHLKLRQRVIATAIVYWKRFYLKHSLVEFEPVRVVVT